MGDDADSLPTLLLGKDVTIYAADKHGRGYKIGYICGINFAADFFWSGFPPPKTYISRFEKSQ